MASVCNTKPVTSGLKMITAIADTAQYIWLYHVYNFAATAVIANCTDGRTDPRTDKSKGFS